MSETIVTPFTWREVSEDRYMEMLEVLWPAAWEPERGFLVGEAWDHKRCSVTGAVGSVAGNVDGNVTPSRSPLSCGGAASSTSAFSR